MIGVLLALVVLFVFYVIDYYRYVAKYPKGPTPLPFFGNAFQMNFARIHDSFAAFTKQHGPVYTLFLPFPTVVLSEYEDVREAFLCKGAAFSGRSESPTLALLNFRANAGVLNASGDEWRDQRRLALMIMRDYGMGKNRMEQLVHESIEEYLEWLRTLEGKPSVNLRWPIQMIISNIINQTLFGFRFRHDDCDELKEYVEGVNELLRGFAASPWLFMAFNFPWLKRIPVVRYWAVTRHTDIMDRLRDFVSKHVKEALADFDPLHDEPACFVHEYATRMPRDAALTIDQLHATVHDLLLNAQETTSATMRWSMIYVAEHQDVQNRVREEILSAVGHERLPCMADRLRMPYTTAVIHEVQRLANIIAMNVLHRTVEDTELKGYKIPANTFVNGDIHFIHRHDSVFKDADKFDPERYLNADGTLNKTLIDRTIPFSIGKRQCPGEGLARMELFLCISATLQHFRILPPQDEPQRVSREPQRLSLAHQPKTILMPVTTDFCIQAV